MTIQVYVARATEKKAQDLLAAARALPEDKQTWQPQEKGRSAVNQVAECAIINGVVVSLLRERAWDAAGRDQRQREVASLDTLALAAARLEENTAALTAAIRAIPDDQMDLEVTLPWTTSTIADSLLVPYWNMCYHEGQINYIQTLAV